jgi:hypothetical protein
MMRLSLALDVWVARELWHILDNTRFYMERPEILVAGGGQPRSERTRAVMQTLREWERIRLENDPARQHCYWIGDGPLESFLPEGLDAEVVWRYEALSAALDQRLPDTPAPLPAACRDTAALSVCLPAAFVLTHLPGGEPAGAAPVICDLLENSGIGCLQVPADDPWQRQESDLLRQVLVQAGLGKWIWSGLKLAVLHLAAPMASAAEAGRREEIDEMDYRMYETELPVSEAPVDYWRDARGFWYPL